MVAQMRLILLYTYFACHVSSLSEQLLAFEGECGYTFRVPPLCKVSGPLEQVNLNIAGT